MGTIGDYLCQQVRRWLRRDEDFKANGRDNIRIPIYSSHCGGDWTPVTNNGQTLYVALLTEASEDVTDPTSELAARKYPGPREDNNHIISQHYWINRLDYTVT